MCDSQKTGWISPKDDLPKNDGMVLAVALHAGRAYAVIANYRPEAEGFKWWHDPAFYDFANQEPVLGEVVAWVPVSLPDWVKAEKEVAK